jgi:hypothetical protein
MLFCVTLGTLVSKIRNHYVLSAKDDRKYLDNFSKERCSQKSTLRSRTSIFNVDGTNNVLLPKLSNVDQAYLLEYFEVVFWGKLKNLWKYNKKLLKVSSLTIVVIFFFDKLDIATFKSANCLYMSYDTGAHMWVASLAHLVWIAQYRYCIP